MTDRATKRWIYPLHDENAAAELAGYAIASVNTSIDNNLEPTLQAHLVTGTYFAMLGGM